MSSLRRQLFKARPTLASLNETDTLREESVESSPDTDISTPEDYSPLEWKVYFDTCRDVVINDGQDTFRVYEIRAESGPLFVFHHGAGQAALSFGLVTMEMRQATPDKFSVLAYDCRGHGHTQTAQDTNLSLQQLSDDLANVVAACRRDEKQDVILVGHSMGGAVVVDAVTRKIIPNVLGVVVLDVVEGSAMESLAYMGAFIQKRPRSFTTLEEAIEWSVQSGGVRNVLSARLSVPPLLRPKSADTSAENPGGYVWRTDLNQTEPYWKEWFKDLSNKFLNCSTAKLLVLANTDRLDNTLTIGQMQGKFQLIVLQDCGHHLQEDAPDQLARTLLTFYQRFQRLNLPIKRFPIPLPPKAST